MDGANQLAGLGAVIRNHRGEPIATAVSTVKSFGDAKLNEAKAVLWGMQAATKAGATSVIIESDSKGERNFLGDLRHSRKQEEFSEWLN